VIFFFSRKSVDKIQVSLNSNKNNVYFTRTRFHMYDNISLILLRTRNVLARSCRENQNTRFMFKYFFFYENLIVYETMSKEYGGPREVAGNIMQARCNAG
jgi:hypothetical protein